MKGYYACHVVFGNSDRCDLGDLLVIDPFNCFSMWLFYTHHNEWCLTTFGDKFSLKIISVKWGRLVQQGKKMLFSGSIFKVRVRQAGVRVKVCLREINIYVMSPKVTWINICVCLSFHVSVFLCVQFVCMCVFVMPTLNFFCLYSEQSFSILAYCEPSYRLALLMRPLGMDTEVCVNT